MLRIPISGKGKTKIKSIFLILTKAIFKWIGHDVFWAGSAAWSYMRIVAHRPRSLSLVKLSWSSRRMGRPFPADLNLLLFDVIVTKPFGLRGDAHVPHRFPNNLTNRLQEGVPEVWGATRRTRITNIVYTISVRHSDLFAFLTYLRGGKPFPFVFAADCGDESAPKGNETPRPWFLPAEPELQQRESVLDIEWFLLQHLRFY